MSEQRKRSSYMQQIDAWLRTEVLVPRVNETEDEYLERMVVTIKQKLLESYRNGQATPRK